MAGPNCLDEEKDGGSANGPGGGLDDEVPASLDLSVDQQQPTSTPPGVEDGNRKMASQESFLTATGPRCSDDLHAGPTIEYKSGLDTFVFPTPSPRLPNPSPRLSPSPRPPTSSSRLSPELRFHSTTPQQTTSDPRCTSPPIGMAIGSPSHAPPSWARPQTNDCIDTRMHQRPPARAPPAVPAVPAVPERHGKGNTIKKQQRAKKTSSWKAFSNLFRKSTKPAPATPEPIYKEKPEEVAVRPRSPPLIAPDRPTSTLPLSARLPLPTPVSSQQSLVRTLSEIQPQPRCESRQPVRMSFNRLLRSPCENPTHSSSPWRGSFFRSDQNQQIASPPHPPTATFARTPRVDIDLPSPELERFSVMFSDLLLPGPSTDSKPTLLERRLSRMSASARAAHVLNTKVDVQPEIPSRYQNSQTSTQPKRPLSIKVDPRRHTATPTTAILRPPPVVRSHTASIYDASEQTNSSPESHSGSTSHSETSLPDTPTTLSNCYRPVSMNAKQQETSTWDMSHSQPEIMCSPDFMNSRVDHSIDLERQMVQVSVARQVSINQARSQVRRTVSTRRPKLVNLAMAKNRKSEAGVFDSVENLHDEMPDARLIKEYS